MPSDFSDIQPNDWDRLRRAIRLVFEQLDDLSGKSGATARLNGLDMSGFNIINGPKAQAKAADRDFVTKQYLKSEEFGRMVTGLLRATGKTPLPVHRLPGLSAGVDDNAVTYAKIQDITAASLLLGRGSAAGAGDPQEITVGTNLSMTGTTLSATGGAGGDSTNTGTYASKPAAGNDGNLYLTSDSVYLLRDNGTAWVPWGLVLPLTEPVSGDFVWINQGGGSIDTTFGGVYLLAPANSGHSLRIRKKAAPATPWTITIAFIPFIFNADFGLSGMILRESGTGKVISYSLQKSTTAKIEVDRWTDPTTYVSTPFVAEYEPYVALMPATFTYLRVNDDGTNLKYSFSVDGVHFRQLLSESRTAHMAGGPDEVGFVANSNNASNDVGCWLIHWKQ